MTVSGNVERINPPGAKTSVESCPQQEKSVIAPSGEAAFTTIAYSLWHWLPRSMESSRSRYLLPDAITVLTPFLPSSSITALRANCGFAVPQEQLTALRLISCAASMRNLNPFNTAVISC